MYIVTKKKYFVILGLLRGTQLIAFPIFFFYIFNLNLKNFHHPLFFHLKLQLCLFPCKLWMGTQLACENKILCQINFFSSFSTWRQSLQVFSLTFRANVCRLLLFCLCKVKRHYRLPGKLGIYCFLTGCSCHGAAKRPYLLTCKASIYFLYADVTASFLFVTALSIHSICTLVKEADTWFCCEQKRSMSCWF